MAEKETKKEVSSETGFEAKPKKEISSEGSSENSMVPKLFSIVTWLTGVIVSLSVAFGMIGGTLSLPVWLGGDLVASIAGWIVVITTLAGVVLAVLNR